MSQHVNYYVQCCLWRSRVRQVAWIPERFATLGATVRLKDNGVWQDGWWVERLGARAPETFVLAHSHDTNAMRRATDI